MPGTTDSTSQPWKSVWPPTEAVVNRASAIPEGLSTDELTNQRAYGSHASNTKGRIIHISKAQKYLDVKQSDHSRSTGRLSRQYISGCLEAMSYAHL
ncbi:hypothetical protein AJ80_01889 [Polytolypa hystricis UAMH7299]|uniref:Uncharacterized protein n=1 Tax=Polytolypa hystricis (strain UAMH7299) TaxID=1447883 RepID=A0A2B7YZB9_POLH7|nr:hypothetical protein AJ80_01889 [Polytolypa hystricis UAMH7299]